MSVGVAWANVPKSELLLAALRLWELKNGYRSVNFALCFHTPRFSNALTFVFSNRLPRMDKADTLRGARVAAGTTSRSFEVQPIEFSYRGGGRYLSCSSLGAMRPRRRLSLPDFRHRPAENLILDLGAVQVAMSGKDVERGPAQPFCP